MAKHKVPKWQKRTPSNDPSLLDAYRTTFEEFRESYNQSRSLELTAQRFGVTEGTVRYHLFPSTNMQMKNAPSRKWAYEKADPKTHKKRIDYKRKYVHVRRHVEDYVKAAFGHSDETLTMEQISESIREQTSISLSPISLEGLCSKVKERIGQPFLIHHLTDPPTYSLAQHDPYKI